MIIEEEILKRLNTKCFGRLIKGYQELSSTNDLAKNMAEELPEGSLIIADVQISGRGRLNRKWFSPEGGLWFTLTLKPPGFNNLVEINYIAVISIIDVLRKNYGIFCSYRWPNDLMQEGKKIGGFLAESKFSGKTLSYVVLGIGLNVNIKEFPEELKENASSLYLLNNRNFNKELLLSEILKELEENYFLWLEFGTAHFLEKINVYCQTLKKKVKVFLENEKLFGIATSIERDSSLKIKLEDGSFKIIYSCDKLEETE